jgi:hypothetical protein
MDIFGMFGFTFGMIAFIMAASLQGEVKMLKKEVEELQQRPPHS